MLLISNVFFYIRHKVQCTLFGSYVDDLNNFIASGDVQNAIVIIQLSKAKHFQVDESFLVDCWCFQELESVCCYF